MQYCRFIILLQKDTRNIRNQILFSFFYKINLILFLFLSNKLVNNQLASNTYVKINLILTVDFILEIPKIMLYVFILIFKFYSDILVSMLP